VRARPTFKLSLTRARASEGWTNGFRGRRARVAVHFNLIFTRAHETFSSTFRIEMRAHMQVLFI